jgi:predicted acyltransferase
MMSAIFATLLASLLVGWFVNRCAAIACLGVCLVLTVWLFLYEVYSPDYGFAMPWLQVENRHAPALARGIAS